MGTHIFLKKTGILFDWMYNYMYEQVYLDSISIARSFSVL